MLRCILIIAVLSDIITKQLLLKLTSYFPGTKTDSKKLIVTMTAIFVFMMLVIAIVVFIYIKNR